MSSMDKPVGVSQDRGASRYCVECGARMPKSHKVCPACGETQK